jgi:hypothetical protein
MARIGLYNGTADHVEPDLAPLQTQYTWNVMGSQGALWSGGIPAADGSGGILAADGSGGIPAADVGWKPTLRGLSQP